MIVFHLILKHRTILLFILQKRLPKCRQHCLKNGKPIILPKSSKYCIFRTIRFCSNFTSMWCCGANTGCPKSLGHFFVLKPHIMKTTMHNEKLKDTEKEK